MAKSFPPDVLVLDTDGLLHVRISRGRKMLQIAHAKSYRLAADTFVTAVVTPDLANADGFAEALRRLRAENGRWDKASLLLPDSWFRINILDLQSLPEGRDEAEEMVRWSLKRTMPIDPTELRVSYEVLSRSAGQVRVIVLTAVEKTLAAIETMLRAAGIEAVLIEPIGLNLWNAIAVREEQTTRERILFYVRPNEFTTAAFRGQQPLFIRSRNLNADRTLEQEIKLSASYLRETLRTESVEHCYLAGHHADVSVAETIGNEFQAPVRTISLGDFAEAESSLAGNEAELAACTGVFT